MNFLEIFKLESELKRNGELVFGSYSPSDEDYKAGVVQVMKRYLHENSPLTQEETNKMPSAEIVECYQTLLAYEAEQQKELEENRTPPDQYDQYDDNQFIKTANLWF